MGLPRIVPVSRPITRLGTRTRHFTTIFQCGLTPYSTKSNIIFIGVPLINTTNRVGPQHNKGMSRHIHLTILVRGTLLYDTLDFYNTTRLIRHTNLKRYSSIRLLATKLRINRTKSTLVRRPSLTIPSNVTRVRRTIRNVNRRVTRNVVGKGTTNFNMNIRVHCIRPRNSAMG